jgi:hypothetical protein
VLHTQCLQQRAFSFTHFIGYSAVRDDATAPGLSVYHRDGAVNLSWSAIAAVQMNASAGSEGVGHWITACAGSVKATRKHNSTAMLHSHWRHRTAWPGALRHPAISNHATSRPPSLCQLLCLADLDELVFVGLKVTL